MDVQRKLDEIVETVGSARSMPMSASCVVNRAELLALLEEVRGALPGSLAQAQELLGGREQMVEEARREAERIVESAHAQRGSLISDTEVVRQAQEEAERVLAEARREAEEIRAEADDYVDSKLANFEVVLTKTIGSVDRGREKLLGRGPGLDEHGYEDEDAPERSADPATLRERADAYVDTKLGAFEAVLSKTLEAVGRGRQKLLGRQSADDLGAHMAAQDGAADDNRRTSDADYLADLAGSRDQAAREVPQQPEPQPQQAPAPYEQPAMPAQQPGMPAQQDYYAPVAGYQQDPYGYQGGYQQQPQVPVDAYGYPQQDAYGWQPQPQQPQDYGQQQYQQDPGQQQPQQAAPALDETSFFDTGMIDLDQLRQYEQGR
ncbi:MULTISPECIES: ATP synthase F0 subunit B [Streptomyces]|uniref:Cell division initiation protein n=1 Tax=Streptomyces lycii TaxID=2654337 RepID=A0ABQ7FJD5_9ACTN|nr:cell division initiation protein [Streptomyces lycii]KAF4409091.1 cell division initiation protein [Streptomyces lycii]